MNRDQDHICLSRSMPKDNPGSENTARRIGKIEGNLELEVRLVVTQPPPDLPTSNNALFFLSFLSFGSTTSEMTTPRPPAVNVDEKMSSECGDHDDCGGASEARS